MFCAFKPDWTTEGPLDNCDRELSGKWQRRLYRIETNSDKPQLYLSAIEGLDVAYPNWPFALVRLGKAYLLLEDLHGALEQFEKALSLLSPLQDERFSQYVKGLRAYITDLETEEDDEWAKPSDGVIVSHWTPPKDIRQYRFSNASGASTIKSAWENLLSGDTTGIIPSRYARLICIESNEIEKVFALGGESLPRLVKVGFYYGAIDRVKAGGVQEPQEIIAILKDLQTSLDFLTGIAKNPSQLSEDIICEIHKKAMKSCRIGSLQDEENTLFYVTHPGVYRKRLITTSLTASEHMIVQYTHQSKVPSEMNLFVNMMKRLPGFMLRSHVSTVHPFTDGNGRVARLLASLPLIQAGYPPINVPVHKREEYLEALFKAQTTLDLQTLEDFLAFSMLDSIDYIRSLPPTSPEDKRYRFNPDLGITRLCL